MAAPAPQMSAQQMQDMNNTYRSIVLGRAVDCWLPIFSQTITTNIPGTVINVPLRNVGLLKRVVIELNGSVVQGAAETQTASPWSIANILSGVVLQDFNSQNRIQTTGWHLHAAASFRRQSAFGAAFTNDSPMQFGNNVVVIRSPSSFTTTQIFRMYFEVPLAYGDYDLRGAMYMGVVNATANLQMTINPTFFVPSTGDNALAAYKSSTAQAGVISTLTIQVHQNYLDQIPTFDNGNPILPFLDLSKMYQLQNTAFSGFTASQDFPIPYANGRNYLSTMLMYDNVGLNAGTDVNYFALTAANNLQFIKWSPNMTSLMARQIMGDDFPTGSYYFDHRKQPINTLNYGNMQLIVNPSSVISAASQFLVGWEFFADINQLVTASSLSAG